MFRREPAGKGGRQHGSVSIRCPYKEDFLLAGGFQDLTQDIQITAANGKPQLAVDVFAHSLTYMKKHLLRAVSAHLGYDPHPDTVRWVLTVPAIWDENAKQFMREAAYKVSNRFRLSSPR